MLLYQVDDDVSEFLACGCGCQKYDGKSCSAAFSCEEVMAYRYDIAELDRRDLDMAVLAQLHAGMNADSLHTNTRDSARPQEHQLVTFTYIYKGRHICQEMFTFLHNICQTRLYNIVEHLIT